MSSSTKDWQSEMENVLRSTEAEVVKTLTQIKSSFDESGQQFDQHFRTHFLGILQNRVTETYDKFLAFANTTKPKIKSTNPFLSDFEEVESTSHDTNDTEGCASSDVSFEYQMKRIHELKQQKKLIQNISIAGLPKNSNENLNEIFKKICKILHVDITPATIYSIYRSSTRITLKFVSFAAKKRFLNAYKSHKSRLMSGDIFETEPNENQNQIFIGNHLTNWFRNMVMKAKAARKDGLLYGYWLTSYGLAVCKTSDAIIEYCLSTEDIDYVIYGFI